MQTQNKTVGVIGAGRIGAAYARMMVEGHKMNLVYFDPYPNKKLVRQLQVAPGTRPAQSSSCCPRAVVVWHRPPVQAKCGTLNSFTTLACCACPAARRAAPGRRRSTLSTTGSCCGTTARRL